MLVLFVGTHSKIVLEIRIVYKSIPKIHSLHGRYFGYVHDKKIFKR